MAYDWQLLDLGGTSRRSVASFRYLSWAPLARIDDPFLASGPGYLISLELLTTGRCLLDIEPTAAAGSVRDIDFTDAFEARGRMTLFAGGATLTLSGFQGDDEPYRWTPANAAEVTAFVNGYVDGTPATLLLELGARQALPGALRAGLRLGEPETDVEAYLAALRVALRPAAPVAEVEALARSLGAALRPEVPVADVEALPGSLRAALRPAAPIADVEARPEVLRIALRPSAPIAGTTAYPPALRTALRPGTPLALFAARPGAVRIALRPTAPRGKTKARPGDLEIAVRLGSAVAYREAAAAALRAALRPGTPLAIAYAGEPVDRARVDARALAGRAQIFALEVEHPAIDRPVRVVADSVEHTIEGERYIPLAFRAHMPQSKEHEVRTAQLRIDNVGRELMAWVEASDGGRDASLRVMRVIGPAYGEGESIVGWEVTMTAAVAEITNEYVAVSLTSEPVFGRPSVIPRHDPATSPGLFIG